MFPRITVVRVSHAAPERDIFPGAGLDKAGTAPLVINVDRVHPPIAIMIRAPMRPLVLGHHDPRLHPHVTIVRLHAMQEPGRIFNRPLPCSCSMSHRKCEQQHVVSIPVAKGTLLNPNFQWLPNLLKRPISKTPNACYTSQRPTCVAEAFFLDTSGYQQQLRIISPKDSHNMHSCGKFSPFRSLA